MRNKFGQFIKGLIPHNKIHFGKCKIDGCERTDQKAFGLCNKHYKKLQQRRKLSQDLTDLKNRLPRTKEHIKNNLAYIKKPGFVSKLKGKTYKEIYGALAIEQCLKRKGKNSGTWRGGLSFQTYSECFKKIRKDIRKRDNFICQECGISEKELNRKLDVHHIDFNKKNNKINNLISLCKKCHGNTQKDRLSWVEYYKNKIGEIK